MPVSSRHRRSAPLHSSSVLATLHLVRHGEVHNPDHVVYADLPGFGLSPTGAAQAASAADRLGSGEVTLVVSSPLQRAVETATPIAAAHGLPVSTDDRLLEWHLANRWAGTVWEDLPSVFPGELEAYLERPTDLEFSPESIHQVAARVLELVAALDVAHPGGVAVVVAHQDPVQAARLALTGKDLSTLHIDKPGHASVITLNRRGAAWQETGHWIPTQQSDAFPPQAT